MAKRASISVPESKLQYGFRTLPKDEPNIKKYREVPEERLWNSDKTVIELKHVKREEEEIEEIDEEEEEEVNEPSKLSYSDIGFKNAKPKCCDFIEHRHEPEQEKCKDHTPPPQSCGCGFIPGNLIEKYENVNNDRENDDEEYYNNENDEEYERSSWKSRSGGCSKGCLPLLGRLLNRSSS